MRNQGDMLLEDLMKI